VKVRGTSLHHRGLKTAPFNRKAWHSTQVCEE
jgi:hypothetical protein